MNGSEASLMNRNTSDPNGFQLQVPDVLERSQIILAPKQKEERGRRGRGG